MLARAAARWTRSTPIQLNSARQQKRINQQSLKLGAIELKSATQQQVLNTAVTCLPGASKLLGISINQATAIGRVKKLEHHHFTLVCRSLSCASIMHLNMGVKRARLLLAARLLILCRQARGLAVLLSSCLQNRIQHRSRTDFSVDLTYSHEWDETDSTFKPFGHGRAIASRMGIHVQTIQQRGQVSVALDSGTLDRTMTWVEEWLCPALVVEGTRGLHLLPAVHKFFPKEFLLTGSVETLKKTLASVDSFTFAPCSDAASGNVVVMKAWGHLIESIRRLVGPRLLSLPDACQVHSHQRGKASMKAVKVHLSRHFSMSKLLRRETVLEAIGKAMKKDIHYRVTRKFEPPPEVHKTRFFKAVDALYNITNPELDKHGKVPLVIVNLRKLAQMVNDDVSAEDWYHYCWRGEGLTPEAPCCESDDACETEICKVVLDCLYGRTEQTPGEGK